MATATLQELVDEMVATLATALSGTVDQVQALINLHPTGLSVDVYPAPEFRETDAAGFGEVTGGLVFTVRARLDIGDVDASQALLLSLMDDEASTSVAMALFDDQTLNGLATSVKVDGPTGFVPYTDAPGTMIGCEWSVTVLRALS